MTNTNHYNSPRQYSHQHDLIIHGDSPGAMIRIQPDEGYVGNAEETRSQSGDEMDYQTQMEHVQLSRAQRLLSKAVCGLSVEERKSLVADIIKTLPNSAKEEIKDLIEHLTHFDPIHYLPSELILQTFAYLSPKDLLTASIISRAWRERAQDENLWRTSFAREGWVLDKAKVSSFEKVAEKKGRKIAENMLKNALPAGAKPGLERKASRKRAREEAFQSDGEGGVKLPQSQTMDGAEEEEFGPSQTAEQLIQKCLREGRPPYTEEETARVMNPKFDPEDEYMEDEPIPKPSASRMQELEAASARANRAATTEEPPSEISFPSTSADFKLAPAVFQPGEGPPKLSWPYLYKQRRRLETNWEKGNYKMFQLPHQDHPEEGHEECVYTIQHTARHLVSGSRDKTIRIWDLTNYRLKGKPLRGHEASVLCLQFDERPEHDIIVSGGSDAYVIIWRFSTGEILKKMTQAHHESVLNLRFDERYIVTCSKDKTIKVWNRNAIARTSDLIPTHAFEDLERKLPPFSTMVEEYTLLITLIGHQAAVNAVQIHENTIVSASGDRTIKSWNLKTGELHKNYVGHAKGIACVQFDGRRIVSGSSDNTVRIFDAEQQAEVACLTGHSNLVRTVQARFGDMEITTDAELEAEAREADRGFYQAVARGMQPANANRRGAARNAGSSRPEDMLSLGTKVPPGGGGSRWAKIVSGSYDETVILWKKDIDGKWVPRLRLHQDMLLRSRRRQGIGAPMTPAHLNPVTGQVMGVGLVQTQTQVQAQQQIANAQMQLVQAHVIAQPGGLGGLNPPIQTAVQQTLGQQTQTMANFAALPPQTGPNPMAVQQANAQPAQTAANPTAQQDQTQTTTNTQTQQNNNNQAAVQGVWAPHIWPHGPVHPQTGWPIGPGGPGPVGPQTGPNLGNNNPPPPPQVTRESNRVFKLQFDTRRIVCCSQNKVIVGWDFANGEVELERAGEWSLETA